MKVRYNPAIGIVLLVLGGLCIVLGFWDAMLGETSPGLFVGWLPLVIGVLQLVRPYFVVTPTSIVVPALIGPVKRQFPYRSLVVENGKLLAVNDDGTRRKVPVARWMARSDDWAIAL